MWSARQEIENRFQWRGRVRVTDLSNCHFLCYFLFYALSFEFHSLVACTVCLHNPICKIENEIEIILLQFHRSLANGTTLPRLDSLFLLSNYRQMPGTSREWRVFSIILSLLLISCNLFFILKLNIQLSHPVRERVMQIAISYSFTAYRLLY